MNINEFKGLFNRQLFLFIESPLKQSITILFSLINNFTKERYRNYKDQKRLKQIERYRALVLSQISFYRSELEKIDRYKAEPLSYEFAEFFFSARERVFEQQRRIDILSTTCFDEFEIDSHTYFQMKLVEQFQKTEFVKHQIADTANKLEISLRTQRFYIEYAERMTAFAKAYLALSVQNQQVDDYFKCFLTDIAIESGQAKDERKKVKFELFCTNVSRYIYQQRKVRNWTQEKLSRESGVNRSIIAKVETLKQIPTLETLFCLLATLNSDILVVGSSTEMR